MLLRLLGSLLVLLMLVAAVAAPAAEVLLGVQAVEHRIRCQLVVLADQAASLIVTQCVTR